MRRAFVQYGQRGSCTPGKVCSPGASRLQCARKRRRRGAALVEAALVLPILLLLTFGIVELGHFFFIQHTLTGAARAGAREGIPHGAVNSDVSAAVARTMQAAGLDSAGYTVTISPSDVGGLTEGTPVSVSVQCSWGAVGVRPLGLLDSDLTVRGVAVMRKE